MISEIDTRSPRVIRVDSLFVYLKFAKDKVELALGMSLANRHLKGDWLNIAREIHARRLEQLKKEAS